MIQGWCLSPARIHVQGASGSWIVLPCVPAARPLRVTGDRLRRQDDEPRPACTCVQKCQCHCGLEDPVGGMCGRSQYRSALHKYSGQTAAAKPTTSRPGRRHREGTLIIARRRRLYELGPLG
jgi:hypothetical protein